MAPAAAAAKAATARRPPPLRRPFAKPTNNNGKEDQNRNISQRDCSSSGSDADSETHELSKLRCASVQLEEVAKRQREKKDREAKRAGNRSADYPGLAFGSAMFGSDTMVRKKGPE